MAIVYEQPRLDRFVRRATDHSVGTSRLASRIIEFAELRLLLGQRSVCAVCAIETTPVDYLGRPFVGQWEGYVVHDEVWAEAGMTEGFLCLGCIEDRLGRELTAVDLMAVPVNVADELDSPWVAELKAEAFLTWPTCCRDTRALCPTHNRGQAEWLAWQEGARQ